jgi:hypothetical protein
MFRHMKVFNGLIGFFLLYAIWGNTYFFSWYGLYDNPEGVISMRQGFGFVLITGVAFVASLLFFTQGFVSTFSLMSNKPEGEDVTVMECLMFVVKRIVKLLPFNLFIIGFAVCLAPNMGGGPFWDHYLKTFEPCKSNWWTNAVFIHNIYPAAFDEKCMGWTWIISCYVQLTILLPIFLMVFVKLPRVISGIFYALIIIGSMAFNIWYIMDQETGLIGRFDNGFYLNNAFLEQVFMKPWF